MSDTKVTKENLQEFAEKFHEKNKSLYFQKSETAETIASAVTDWLEDNVDPVGSAVVVDDSLTIEGAAADAKKTGDEIDDINNALEPLYKTFSPYLVADSYWVPTGSPAGFPASYNGWSRTNRIPCTPGEHIKIVSTVKSVYNIFFNSDTDGDMNSSFTVNVGENEIVIPSGANFYALSNTTAGMNYTTITQILRADEVLKLDSKIDDEIENISSILSFTDSYKTVDFASAVASHYVDNTGTYSENNAFNILKNVALKKGQTIHISLRGTYTVATLAQDLGDNEYKPLLIGQGGSAVAEQEYTATEDMTVSISYSNTYSYSAYIYTNASYMNDLDFYCTPTSGFYNALEEIRSNTSLGMRTLYVEAGEYDLYEELGGDEYANSCIPDSSYVPPATAWKHFSVVCPDRLKIIGLGDVTFKFNIPAETWSEGAIPNSVLSPLSFRYGCEVENIKIECANTRYGIHIEGSGESGYNNVRYIFKDVTVVYTLTDTGYPSAIGCGLNANDNLELSNCVLKVISSSGNNNNGIKGHLNNGSANVYIDDCYINAPTSDFNVEWNTNGKDSRFRFSNTKLSKIILTNGNLASTPFNVEYEMIRTDADLVRPSDTTITMPTITNYGSTLNIESW